MVPRLREVATKHTHPIAECLIEIKRALDGWVPKYNSLTLTFEARSPQFNFDGIAVHGSTPDEVIDRVGALVMRMGNDPPTRIVPRIPCKECGEKFETRQGAQTCAESHTRREVTAEVPRGGAVTFTGDICGICGQPAVVRESSCRTKCHSCGAIDGGCG